jgi:hypothetical protein
MEKVQKKYSYKDKTEYLKSIRKAIKNKKIIFDDTKSNFGFDKMKLLTKVNNTSEVKGYPFELYNKDEYKESNFKYALKVVPTELKFDKKCNPSALEIKLLKNLTSDLVDTNICPSIVYYLTNIKSVNRCEALKCIDLKRLEAEDRIRKNSCILISEFINGSNLRDWVYDRCDRNDEPSNIEWQGLIFQILYTLFVLQDKYKLMHNDMHYGNILMDTSIKAGGYFVYKLIDKNNVETVYYIKNYGVIPKLWDFEFSMMYSDEISDLFPNKLVIGDMGYNKKEHKTIEEYSRSSGKYSYNMPVQYNRIYDSHYFLCSLFDLVISQEVFDWIKSIYPEDVIPSDSSSSSDGSSESSDSEDDYSEDDSEYSDSEDDLEEDDSDDGGNLIKKLMNIKLGKDGEKGSDNQIESYVTSSSDYTSICEKYIDSGRLINYKSDHMKIPTTDEILGNKFFDKLKQVPDDYIESDLDNVYFEYTERK